MSGREEKEYKFYLERLFEKIPLPFNFTAILLVLIFEAIVSLVLIYTCEFQIFIRSPVAIAYGFSGALCMIMMKILRDKTIDAIEKLRSKIDKQKELEDVIRKIFCSEYQLLVIAISPIALLYNIYCLRIGIWKWSFYWWLLGTLWFIFHSPLIVMITLFCIGTAFLIHFIGSNIPPNRLEVYHPDRTAGLKALVNLGLVNVYSWILSVGILGPSVIGWVLEPLTIIGLIFLVIFTISLFLIPSFSIYKIILKAKEKELAKISDQYEIVRKEFEEVVLKGDIIYNINVIATVLSNLKIFEDKIKSTRVFDIHIMLKLISSFSTQLLLLIIKPLLKLLFGIEI